MLAVVSVMEQTVVALLADAIALANNEVFGFTSDCGLISVFSHRQTRYGNTS